MAQGIALLGPSNNDGYNMPTLQSNWQIPGVEDYYVPPGETAELTMISWQFFLDNIPGTTNENVLLHITTLQHDSNLDVNIWSKNAQIQSDNWGNTLWRCYVNERVAIALPGNSTTRARVYNQTAQRGRVGLWLAYRPLP